MSLLNNKQYKIDIKNSLGIPYNLAVDDALGLGADINVSWIDFCNKITIKQKRYGEPSVATLSFIMLSGNGAIGKNKKAIITFPCMIGDKVEVTILNGKHLSEYFDAAGALANVKQKIFVGYIWNITKKHTGEVEIVCYDLMKYLQGQRLFFSYNGGATAMQVIEQAKKAINLGRGEPELKLKLDHTLFGMPFDTTGTAAVKIWMYDKNFIQLVNWLLNRILVYGMVKDIGFATYLCFLMDYDTNTIQIGQSATLGRLSTMLITEKSLMTSFEISESIESDVFNTVYYLVDTISENIGERIPGVVAEIASTEQYGSICHYENFSQNDFLSSDSTMTLEKVKKIAKNMVLFKCKPKTKITVKALGNPYLHAGMQIGVKMPEGLGSGYMIDPTCSVGKNMPRVLIDEITHTIENGKCEMEFTASVALATYNSWTNTKAKEIEG